MAPCREGPLKRGQPRLHLLVPFDQPVGKHAHQSLSSVHGASLLHRNGAGEWDG